CGHPGGARAGADGRQTTSDRRGREGRRTASGARSTRFRSGHVHRGSPPVTILIADDDPASRRLLHSTLKRLGHEVVAVADGSEALEILRRPDGPHLAILDWDMPELDGPEVCRAIRERPAPPAPYVYIILLTARTRHEDMVAGLDAEAD